MKSEWVKVIGVQDMIEREREREREEEVLYLTQMTIATVAHVIARRMKCEYPGMAASYGRRTQRCLARKLSHCHFVHNKSHTDWAT
jgi:hypothetical protein